MTFLRLLGRLPLAWLHALGALLGWLVYFASPVYAARMRENLERSGIYADRRELERALRECVAQTGKTIAETPKVWFDDAARVTSLVRCDTWHVIDEALAEGRGIIFLTPHLGCFEISAMYVAQRLPLTVLYRPPKQRWLEPLMIKGRIRGKMKPEPASLKGVRALYKALQRGEPIGILPDQAPQVGEGAWADFFGRPAYTITLVTRLRKQSKAPVIFAFAKRLPRGAGYELIFDRHDGEIDERELNRALEELIRTCPTQYLWSYNRYKTPRGAAPVVEHESKA
jgi:Kdo2-lipid IVA lauroyltransferase/acyltransferase